MKRALAGDRASIAGPGFEGPSGRVALLVFPSPSEIPRETISFVFPAGRGVSGLTALSRRMWRPLCISSEEGGFCASQVPACRHAPVTLFSPRALHARPPARSVVTWSLGPVPLS